MVAMDLNTFFTFVHAAETVNYLLGVIQEPKICGMS